MSSIHYIIATYSGWLPKRTSSLAGHELTVQLSVLRSIFTKKKQYGLPCLVTHITVVCPVPSSSSPVYSFYYMERAWEKIFQTDFGIPLCFLPYTGTNQHHSYDQWIQGFLFRPSCDYHLCMEDDYCIHPDILTFDIDLVNLYQKRFSHGIGYLCSLFQTLSEHPEYGRHAMVSNGLISRSTFDLLDTIGRKKGIVPISVSPYLPVSTLLPLYYFTRVPDSIPQLMFSNLFSDAGIPCSDFIPEYKVPFWSSHMNHCREYNMKNSSALFLLIPQEFLVYTTKTFPCEYLHSLVKKKTNKSRRTTLPSSPSSSCLGRPVHIRRYSV